MVFDQLKIGLTLVKRGMKKSMQCFSWLVNKEWLGIAQIKLVKIKNAATVFVGPWARAPIIAMWADRFSRYCW